MYFAKFSGTNYCGPRTHRKTPPHEEKRDKPKYKQRPNFDTGSGTEKQKIRLRTTASAVEPGAKKKTGFDVEAILQQRDMPFKTKRRQDAGKSAKAKTTHSEPRKESFGGCYSSFKKGPRATRVNAAWSQLPVYCSIYEQKQRKRTAPNTPAEKTLGSKRTRGPRDKKRECEITDDR